MRNLHLLDIYRVRSRQVLSFYGGSGNSECGVFAVPSPIDGGELLIVASAGEGWDHVSVSRKNRCPNWPEMAHVAKLFFRDDEAAFQLHVPASEHVNNHPYCLHWWRPHGADIPRPPDWMVGDKSLGELPV